MTDKTKCIQCGHMFVITRANLVFGAYCNRCGKFQNIFKDMN